MHWIDHNFLPDIRGTVDRFLVNNHGKVDGLVLMCDPGRFLFVHLPPHLGPALTAAVAQGDAVAVRGIRPRGADMIAAVAFITSDGRLILDNGPDHQDESPEHEPEKAGRMGIKGVVRMPLFGPKGELRGALLDNGDSLRIPPKEAVHVADLLRPGAAVAARGKGIESRYGRVVDAAEVGPELAELRPAHDYKHVPKPKKASAGSPKEAEAFSPS